MTHRVQFKPQLLAWLKKQQRLLCRLFTCASRLPPGTGGPLADPMFTGTVSGGIRTSANTADPSPAVKDARAPSVPQGAMLAVVLGTIAATPKETTTQRAVARNHQPQPSSPLLGLLPEGRAGGMSVLVVLRLIKASRNGASPMRWSSPTHELRGRPLSLSQVREDSSTVKLARELICPHLAPHPTGLCRQELAEQQIPRKFCLVRVPAGGNRATAR